MALYKSITASTQLKVGAAKLLGIIAASGTNPTVAVYDSATASSSDETVIGTMTFGTTPASVVPTGDQTGLYLSKGLYVVIGGTNPVVTIVYE